MVNLKDFLHWKRIVHIIVTLLMIIFLIWYYTPENKLIRSLDVCGYYAGKTNQTCQCTPIIEGRQSITTFYYPNYSLYKNRPVKTKDIFNIDFTGITIVNQSGED